MSRLYVLAGRTGNGKTEYLNRVKNESPQTVRIVSALDYASHEALVRELYNLVQDSTCRSIAIDDYEVALIKTWGEQIINKEYQKCLSILAGFSESFDVDVIVAVGLKREADKDASSYYDKANLRSPIITAEADKIIFIKQGRIKEMK